MGGVTSYLLHNMLLHAVIKVVFELSFIRRTPQDMVTPAYGTSLKPRPLQFSAIFESATFSLPIRLPSTRIQ